MRAPQLFFDGILPRGEIQVGHGKRIVHLARLAGVEAGVEPLFRFHHGVVIIVQSRSYIAKYLAFISKNRAAVVVLIKPHAILQVILISILICKYIISMAIPHHVRAIFIDVCQARFIVLRYKKAGAKVGVFYLHRRTSECVSAGAREVWRDAQDAFTKAKSGFAGAVIIRIFHGEPLPEGGAVMPQIQLHGGVFE